MTADIGVVDSSVIVAALLDSSGLGQWSRRILVQDNLHAPQLAVYETANAIRRRYAAGELGPHQGDMAIRRLVRCPIDWWLPQMFVARMWDLRGSLTSFEAAFVALAEHLGAPLYTLDLRLARAPGIRCPVVTAPAP